MKIRCEQCGREYEVAEFANNEIVECECGYKWRLQQSGTKKPAANAPRPTAPKGKTELPPAAADVFVGPKIANWIYSIGMMIAILGILGLILGIIAFFLDGAKNLLPAVFCIPVIVSGVFIIGFGAALDYLAEIAFNTRKK